MAGRLGVQRLILETDSQAVVNMWRSLASFRAEISPVLVEIKGLSRNFMVLFYLCFVSRHCNGAAHLCAKQVPDALKRCEWLSEAPSFMHDSVLRDRNPD